MSVLVTVMRPAAGVYLVLRSIRLVGMVEVGEGVLDLCRGLSSYIKGLDDLKEGAEGRRTGDTW